MDRGRVLISGGGIAGLTLAILLKQQGFEPLVIEREPALPADGYMMDFFGTGWDVAERMGLVDELRAIRYPIDALEFVDSDGHARVTIPIERIRNALGGKYVYLRRTDLARILFERVREAGIEVRFGTSIKSFQQNVSEVQVEFADNGSDSFALLFGADGIHSRVRELLFGPERRFDRFLGYYVAAFHITGHDYPIGRAFKLYEEPNRLVGIYPLDQNRCDATYVFRHSDVGPVYADERLPFVRASFKGAGWIAERVLQEHDAADLIYFDSATQIRMPKWHQERTALLGDACGCLTLMAGQGSQMAMADAYVLAQELQHRGDNYRAAFQAYEEFLKPSVASKQRDAAWFANLFVPTERSHPALRHAVTRLIFSPLLARYLKSYVGDNSVLAGRA